VPPRYPAQIASRVGRAKQVGQRVPASPDHSDLVRSWTREPARNLTETGR